MNSGKYIFYALSLELASLLLLIQQSHELADYLMFLLLHGMASGVLTALALQVLPKQYRSPLFFVALLVFGFTFFVPYLGFILALLSIAVGLYLPTLIRPNTFNKVALPDYTPMPSTRHQNADGVDLKSLLTDNSLPDDQRIQGMLAVKSLPVRITGRILRDSLGDDFEDLRLLAYGVLDQKEKDVTIRIDRAKNLLKHADERRKPRLLRLLSELYWELVYQDLVRGDIKQLAMDKALEYSGQALDENKNDGQMWFLQGRVYLEGGQFALAETCLKHAKSLGMPSSRINPWLAEAALMLKNPLMTQALMTEISGSNQTPASKAAIDYWSKFETS